LAYVELKKRNTEEVNRMIVKGLQEKYKQRLTAAEHERIILRLKVMKILVEMNQMLRKLRWLIPNC